MNHYKTFQFDNGFSYLTSKNNSLAHCILLLLVGTGSVNEKKAHNGISHFLEHLPFKGTKTHKNAKTLSYILDTLGTETNAFTDREFTGYYIKISKKNSIQGLQLLAELVLDPLLRKKDIEDERLVILEEYERGLDEPDHIVDEMLHKILFRNHPISNSVIGTKKSIQNISVKDLREYHKTHYVPSNMNLVLIGNYPNKIHDHIKKLFRPLSKVEYPYRQPAETSSSKPTFVVKKNIGSEQTCISISFPTVNYNHKDKYILELIETCLSDGMSSRLFTELREKHSLVYTVHAEQLSYQKVGYFEINTCLKDKNIEKTFHIILQELNKLKKKLISKKELDKCKNYVKGNTVITNEDLSNIAEYYAYQLTFEKKIINFNTYFKHLNQVTPEQIKEVANTYFDLHRICVIIYGKMNKKTYSRMKKHIHQ